MLKNYKRFDFLTDNYKNKASYLKLNPKEPRLHHFSPAFLQNFKKQ